MTSADYTEPSDGVAVGCELNQTKSDFETVIDALCQSAMRRGIYECQIAAKKAALDCGTQEAHAVVLAIDLLADDFDEQRYRQISNGY